MGKIATVLSVVTLMWAQSASADSEPEPDAAPPLVGEEVIVLSGELNTITDEAKLIGNALEPLVNLGEGILKIPGVAGVRRAASAVEPVVRGMGRERVATQVGIVPLFGACPSHMDPAITLLSPIAGQVTVAKGGSRFGPAGATGGRIIVATDIERSTTAPAVDGFAGTSYETARAGKRVDGGIIAGNRRFDLRAAGEVISYEQYRAAGVEVPADVDKASVALALGLNPRRDHRMWNTVYFTGERAVDFPALPMDIDESTSWIQEAGYRVAWRQGVLRRLEFRAGLARVDHLMSNRQRANRGMVEAETPAESRTYAGGGVVALRLGATELSLGADWYLLRRDAMRTRHLPATGLVFFDHIWPQARQASAGAYASLERALPGSLHLRAGVRGYIASSAAGTADDRSLGGLSIREQYERFYGAGAADTDRIDPLAAAPISLHWFRGPIATHVAVALSMRAPAVTERYFAFGPAPGGFQVGNPALASEKKWELDVGGRGRTTLAGWEIEVRASGFAAIVDDYVLPTAIARQDIDGDGAADLVRGFRNISAGLVGVEVEADFALPRHALRGSFVLAHVRGQNRSDDRPLPEIPPLDVRAHLRWQPDNIFAEAGARLVAHQQRIDAEFAEDGTPGFALVHARVGLTLGNRIRLAVGVDNLFDSDYHEHLTREAMMAVGDLLAGDEIPAPGRSFFLSCRFGRARDQAAPK